MARVLTAFYLALMFGPADAGSQELTLAALTVPKDRLPAGCRLAPVPMSPDGKPMVVGYPRLTANPWVGTDSGRLRSIRDAIDGPPYAADREPWSKRADDVVEGYRAIYVTAEDQTINVYAVRFTDPALTAKALLRKIQGQRMIVRGSTAVWLLAGRDGDCLRAVADHIGSARGLGGSRQ